ncbi:uncharacterized protein LOC110730443 [Chenopodium quinoa]|uniref:uncharacterized protein LOC110730443 n=1 Tax=Chenopodium quinoa TaxID=63459 RepID=UPI000B78C72C|nr:uncharacterized protein LOC110730443 [Chenopodium quinoa]
MPFGTKRVFASAPLTPIVNPGGGIRPIALGTAWRHLVSKVAAVMVGQSLGSYFDGLQCGVGVSLGGEAILHAMNRLIEDRDSNVGLSMLLVDFQNAFNLVDRAVMLREVRRRCHDISRWVEFYYSNPARLYAFEVCLQAWYLDDGTIIGETLVLGKVMQLIMEEGPRFGLHLNVEKTETFWHTEDPRSRLVGVFPLNIAQPLHGVKLLGGPTSSDSGFSGELVMQRVTKTIALMDKVAKLDDPQCELLLLRACTGVSKLYFALRTCPPSTFEATHRTFDEALRSSLERIVTALGPGFGDWQ